jgi:hypothetical protein
MYWAHTSYALLEVVLLTSDNLYNPVMGCCWNPWMLNYPFRSDSRCIYTKQFCYNKKSCQVGADEDPEFCQKNACGLNVETFPGDLQCVNDTQFCNGIRDCNAVPMATERISMVFKAFSEYILNEISTSPTNSTNTLHATTSNVSEGSTGSPEVETDEDEVVCQQKKSVICLLGFISSAKQV